MLTESKKHKGLLQHLTVVLNWFTWLAKHHKKWRNPIIINAFFGITLYEDFYALSYQRPWVMDPNMRLTPPRVLKQSAAQSLFSTSIFSEIPQSCKVCGD
jgi:hypothetical protein